jgi:23S rRNA pseudouridine1911/1915/1917 synthase
MEVSRRQSIALGSEVRGQRLDQVLVAHMQGWSRTRLQELIREGRVRLSGAEVTKPGHLIEEACELSIALPPEQGSVLPAGLEPRVLFEDQQLVALDKPAGLLSHANAGGREGGVAEWAAARWGELPHLEEEERAGLAHRLDRDTSGVLLLAKTQAALEGLKAAFQARAVQKTYLALVQGTTRFDSEWIENWIGRDERSRDRIRVLAEGEGRFSSTYYETRERFRDFSFLAVFPKTGRMHQVRVHLASIGFPLLGEHVYRPARKHLTPLPPEAPQLARHALHASALELLHPLTGEALRFESPLPADMQAVLDWLRKNRAE